MKRWIKSELPSTIYIPRPFCAVLLGENSEEPAHRGQIDSFVSKKRKMLDPFRGNNTDVTDDLTSERNTREKKANEIIRCE